ncbi:GDP-mannose:glycolipid 4-beta-D-mannosyltransferase [Arthrobacter sp. SO5]|uniref:glycosyltransferase n=1 Tax=Arthrobacter sp. SO5 TaxID=1897055 RepID=UPI001E5085B7|nr:glycosyltransferase [Arthrobacter sp. SO5]MCB5272572.1 GDP-mannose:glycolipid 4-beta-D-mannosyltransferase [Arthrobacter sp. SO5]
MQLKLRGYFKAEGSPLTEANAAIEMLAPTSSFAPHVLGYTPVGRVNPYQSLLYKAAADYDIATVPIIDSWSFDRLAAVRPDASHVILHIHWTSFVLNGIKSYTTAEKKIEDFQDSIDSFKSRGGRIVWTLHNIIPHDSLFPDLEMRAQQILADEADVLHVLSEASADMMSSALLIDKNKLLTVAHPNYRMTYEDYVTRNNARLEFGIGPKDRVYVLLGALKSYKGLNRLLDAFDAFCAADRTVPRILLVGGNPDGTPEVAEFIARCQAHPNVLIEDKKIANHFVQNYMRAADVGLAPYTRMLNSGAILLYQSFDLPVIASDVPAIWEDMPDEIGERVYDNSLISLVEAFQRADRFFQSGSREAVRRYADQFDAMKLSREFSRGILEKLDDQQSRQN